jgi:biopolymer transport protein ExbD
MRYHLNVIDLLFKIKMKKKNILFEEENIEVSLTPLIDTVLVLLIVFILVSPQLEQALKIYLPSGKSGNFIKKNSFFCIAINQHGKIFLKNQQKVDKNELMIKIKEYKKLNEKTTIILFADKDLLLHQITDIIDEIYKIGIQNVLIKTKKINF